MDVISDNSSITKSIELKFLFIELPCKSIYNTMKNLFDGDEEKVNHLYIVL